MEYAKLLSTPNREILDQHGMTRRNDDEDDDAGRKGDGGAAFVLVSKGTWWHAGFHLTTAIAGPSILTLPYALSCMGWTVGVLSLSIAGAVTFYSYFLMSKVLDNCDKNGRRHIRFRELASDIL
ncbi:hypothetical protein KI387_029880, partial [Taxus chinensis]